MLLFILWALIVTLMIPLRYTYGEYYALNFGLLKIAKFALYCLAGWLTVRVMANERQRRLFLWSALAATLVVSLGLLLTRDDSLFFFAGAAALVEQAYKDNSIALVAAIFLVVMLGLWLDQRFAALRWRRAASIVLPIIVLGIVLARGRGAWVAALVGSVYLLVHYRKWRALVAVAVGLFLLTIAYLQIDVFRDQVERTLNPDQAYLERYDAGLGGIDVGGRSAILLAELPKVLDAPVFGRGFFHRGGQSGIYSTGSHNYFLQIFLETGIVGGGLLLAIGWLMWKATVHPEAERMGLRVPVRAALLTAFVGGLSGEYFYGGLPLLTILVIYGLIGSLPQPRLVSRPLVFNARKSLKPDLLRNQT